MSLQWTLSYLIWHPVSKNYNFATADTFNFLMRKNNFPPLWLLEHFYRQIYSSAGDFCPCSVWPLLFTLNMAHIFLIFLKWCPQNLTYKGFWHLFKPISRLFSLVMSFKRIRGSPKPCVTFLNTMDVYGRHLTGLV